MNKRELEECRADTGWFDEPPLTEAEKAAIHARAEETAREMERSRAEETAAILE